MRLQPSSLDTVIRQSRPADTANMQHHFYAGYHELKTFNTTSINGTERAGTDNNIA